MDPNEMYERHAATEGRVLQEHHADNPRDAFVIETLRARTDGARPRRRIIELSIGDGGLTREILRQVPNCHLTCFEISATRIENVRASLGPIPDGSEVEFVPCNLDETFHTLVTEPAQAVVAMDILEHVFDVFGFIESCARLLSPNGTLILRVPNIAYLKRRLTLLAGELPVTASWFGPSGRYDAWRDQYGWDGSHLHLFTVSSLTRLLDIYGLSVVSVGDPGARLARLRSFFPGLLCGNIAVVAEKR